MDDTLLLKSQFCVVFLQKNYAMAHLHELSISEIKRLTHNAVEIHFDVPEALHEDFAFSPGQYITLEHTVGENTLRRAYSLASEAGKNSWSVGIKKVENGRFSSFANDSLQVGDNLQVLAPEGMFTLPADFREANHTYVAFAAGSGITPIMSMIQTVLRQNQKSTFILVFGNQNVAETMYYDTLEALRVEFPDRFMIHYFFSRENKEGATFGRIERSYVNFLLKKYYEETTIHSYYLCGPEEMIFEVKDTLVDRNIPATQIKFELFTSSSEGDSDEILEGQTEVTITVDDLTETFVMSQKTTLLDAALDKNLDPPYSCQGGVCSSCIARLKEGEVAMEKNLILTDSEIEEGLILTCQAHPTSAKVVVDYDDV